MGSMNHEEQEKKCTEGSREDAGDKSKLETQMFAIGGQLLNYGS